MSDSYSAHILVVDDETIMLNALISTLSEKGFNVSGAKSAGEAVDLCRQNRYDLIITDLRMPGEDGIWLLSEIKENWPSSAVIVMTAYGTIDRAVEAMKKGAYDFITKPFSFDQIEFAIKRALERQGLIRENQALKTGGSTVGPGGMVGDNVQMKSVFELIKKVAPSPATVLVTGESGTGKELVARALHDLSGFSEGPFVPVNCSAIPENLLESELFGHVRGAFTGAERDREGRFEMAEGGTIFLDEIGEISQAIQVKLLRVLQEKVIERVGSGQPIPLNVRVLAATNRNLMDEINNGRFREDLYWRLNVINIHLPPLRERRDDIPRLLKYFLWRYSKDTGREVPSLSPEVLEALELYDWPGNIRELQNVVQRMLVLESGPLIDKCSLPSNLRSSGPVSRDDESLAAMERVHIIDILNRYSWNLSETSRRLGIDRKTLYNKMKRYEIRSK